MRSATLLVILTLLAAGRADAQKGTRVDNAKERQAAIGNTARVSTRSGQMFEGKLVTLTADTVSLSPVSHPSSWQGRPWSVATNTVSLIEVEHIRTRTEGLSHSLKKGVVFGAFIGVAVGLLRKGGYVDNVITYAVGAGLAGVAVYSAYGYLAPGTEWTQVHP